MRLHLLRLDPEKHYPPHALITDDPEALRIAVDLTSGEDLRFVLRDRPHSAVAYVLSSTHRERTGFRTSFYPLVAFAEPADTETLISMFDCCKWSERLLGSDWEADARRYRVYGCRLTERYLLEFVYRLYQAGGFVIPGHVGDRSTADHSLPFHIDLAQSSGLGLDPDTVAEIRDYYGRDLANDVTWMSPEERALWGIDES